MIFGWDISTSIIGITVLTDEGIFVESSFLDLRKCEGLIEKTFKTHCHVKQLTKQQGYTVSTHYVEDRLGNFSKGFTSMQTLMTLAAFNSIVSYLIWNEFREQGGDVEVIHLHLMTIKSAMKKQGLVIPKGGDKKKITLAWVSSVEPKFPVTLNRNDKPQPYCYDMADSFVVARTGYLRGCKSNAK